MRLETIYPVLSSIQGCTFASLDTVTTPSPGMTKKTTGENVLLFAAPGYEAMVKRRLLEAGKDPDEFVVGDLPWGERVEGTPFIANNGKTYLQTILIRQGLVEVYFGQRLMPSDAVPGLLARDKSYLRQGLDEGRAVVVRTYSLDNITSITVMGRTYRED